MGNGAYTTRLSERYLREVSPQSRDVVQRVLLYDYDTGRPELLPQHVQGIDRYVLPFLRESSPPCSVWIGGIASRRGDRLMNEGLAWARARRVEQYIVPRASGLGGLTGRHGLMTTWHGERYSAHGSENSAYYRAVLVVIQRAPTYVPPPRPESPQRAQMSNRFRIRYDWGYDGGEILVAGASTFVIDYDQVDPRSPAPDPHFYRLVGLGAGGGLPVGGGIGGPNVGWNRFTSERVTTPRRFSGAARLASRVAGNLGHTVLVIGPAATSEDIRIDPFEVPGGVNIALGASWIFGPFFVDWEYTERRRREGTL